MGGARDLAASELTRLSETEDAGEEGVASGALRARAVSPVCPTFKVPPCSRGRVLPVCRPAPCSRNGMTSSGGVCGSGCCQAGGIGLHARPRPRKVRAPAGPRTLRPWERLQGGKVMAWSPEAVTAIRDLRTRTGVGLSVGANLELGFCQLCTSATYPGPCLAKSLERSSG